MSPHLVAEITHLVAESLAVIVAHDAAILMAAPAMRGVILTVVGAMRAAEKIPQAAMLAIKNATSNDAHSEATPTNLAAKPAATGR